MDRYDDWNEAIYIDELYDNKKSIELSEIDIIDEVNSECIVEYFDVTEKVEKGLEKENLINALRHLYKNPEGKNLNLIHSTIASKLNERKLNPEIKKWKNCFVKKANNKGKLNNRYISIAKHIIKLPFIMIMHAGFRKVSMQKDMKELLEANYLTFILCFAKMFVVKNEDIIDTFYDFIVCQRSEIVVKLFDYLLQNDYISNSDYNERISQLNFKDRICRKANKMFWRKNKCFKIICDQLLYKLKFSNHKDKEVVKETLNYLNTLGFSESKTKIKRRVKKKAVDYVCFYLNCKYEKPSIKKLEETAIENSIISS